MGGLICCTASELTEGLLLEKAGRHSISRFNDGDGYPGDLPVSLVDFVRQVSEDEVEISFRDGSSITVDSTTICAAVA